MEQQLKNSLSTTISEFNKRRFQILQKAFQDGGQDEVLKLEEEYDALRDAYFEILKRELDENNHLYAKLLKAANDETENLTQSIKQLNNINDIIKLTTAVINLVGRILIVLGI
ncbi:MAG: hypothetical protein LCH91_01850 [Bacteroidetes bacterium]|nr:hypothetical protein [Bacteroidota bacterium]